MELATLHVVSLKSLRACSSLPLRFIRLYFFYIVCNMLQAAANHATSIKPLQIALVLTSYDEQHLELQIRIALGDTSYGKLYLGITATTNHA